MDQFYLGQIFMGGWNFPPRYSVFANGELLAINAYQSLYSLYGTSFGGDGRTTFALPDLRGRAAVALDKVGGSNAMGERGGSETNTLAVANLPPHTHTLRAANGTATSGTADGNALAHETNGNTDVPDIYEDATPTIAMHAGCFSNTGSGTAVNNMQPFLAISYCVAMQGLFPPRN